MTCLVKKRILFVSMAAYPLFNKGAGLAYGGAELDLYTIATTLDSDSFETHFLTGDFGQNELEKYEQVTVHRGQKIVNSNYMSGAWNFLRFLNIVRKINPDIIFTEAAGWLTVECIIAKLLLGKKLIFRSAHIKNINGFTDSRGYGYLYRRLINHIDCFILQNDQDIPTFHSSFTFTQKVLVIRNLQTIPQTDPLPQERRKNCLWVGRSEEIKDPRLFIEVAKLLPESSFVMIAPETNKALFHDLKKSAQEVRNLRFIPGLDRESLMPFFAEALFLINTSQAEGFPNVILEALKHGTPIISARLDFDSILKKHGCGIISGDSPEQIVKTINGVSKTAWSAYSQNAYAFSQKHFNIVNGIKKYEKLFLQI
ncbi:MAG: hypothetical protein QG664_207 [Patescibacteria group bacterium]|nr:hypothetical protein [Patescibacteria group bacterium]